jgi:hypothetical protein
MLDLFQKESVKVEVCKNILQKYKSFCCSDEVESTVYINDPVVINAFMCVAKVLSDGVK